MFCPLFILWSLLTQVIQASTSTDLSTFASGSQGIRLIASDYDSMGTSIANAGDFNKDGIQDFIVGVAQYTKGTYSHAGMTLIILGGDLTSATEIDTATFTSGSRGMRLLGGFATGTDPHDVGFSVGAAGDINHDGYADVMTGAPNDPQGKGFIYVIFGKAGPYTDIPLNEMAAGPLGFTIRGQTSSNIGSPTTGIRGKIGDINGDGLNDFMIGSYRAPCSAGNYCGAVSILYGKASTDPVTDVDLSNLGTQGIAITGAAAGNFFGTSIANVGDANGDGFNDILVGAPDYNLAPNSGAVYLLYGSNAMTSMDLSTFVTGSMGVRFLGGAGGDTLGDSVTRIGDINGDSLADFAMSASNGSPLSRTEAGIVYVVYGSRAVRTADVNMATFTAGPAGYAIFGMSAGAWLGMTLSSAGDQNHDGLPDLLIGVQGLSAVYLLYSAAVAPSADIDLAVATNIHTFTAGADAGMGLAVDGGKDLTGDGIPDIMVCAEYLTVTPAAGGASRTQSGAAFVLAGPFAGDAPTAAPTFAPSARPTSQVQEQEGYALTLAVEQTVYFVTADEYLDEQAACDLAIQHTVAASMDGVSPDGVTDIVVSEGTESAAQHLFSLRTDAAASAAAADGDSFLLSFKITVHDPLLTYDALKAQLIEAASTGAMDENLHMFAPIDGARSLANSTFSAPDVRNAAAAADDGSASKLPTDAETTAMTICIIVGVCLLAAVMLFATGKCATGADAEKKQQQPAQGAGALELVPTEEPAV